MSALLSAIEQLGGVMADVELFRRTKHAVWSIRNSNLDHVTNINSVYAKHYGCNDDHNSETSQYAWFADDDLSTRDRAECYQCACPVPEYIQALLRLYIGE